MYSNGRVFVFEVGSGRNDLPKMLHDLLVSQKQPAITIGKFSCNDNGLSLCKDEALSAIAAFDPHAVLAVISGSNVDMEVLSRVIGVSGSVPVIVILESSEPESIVELFKQGAVDFVTPPLRKQDVIPRLWRAMGLSRPREPLTTKLKERLGLNRIIGESPAFVAEIEKIPQVARCDAGVLITGETGTGKELCARALHYLSPRSGGPFVAVNCGAIPSELVENELFGHIKGAFTGAHVSQRGLIREAHGGTLFLDDVDSLPLAAQVKFLRFLQEKEYKELGSAKTSRADVRVVAATNVDLEEATGSGRFRKDLYYRLNIIPITLPPLRERMEDIPLLARHFLVKYTRNFNKEACSFSGKVLSELMCHHWPGNVRELENAVERAVVFSTGEAIETSHMMFPVKGKAPVQAPGNSLKEAKARAIEQFERGYVEELLRTNGGNISKAARAARKNRRAFWELIRKYKIDPLVSGKNHI